MKTLSDAAALAGILDRLDRLPPNAPAHWGRMSAHQMLCHLTDSFLACFGEKYASPATGLFERTVMKWAALYMPLPWPKDIATRPEIDQVAGGGTPPAAFDQDRQALVGATARFCDPTRDSTRDFHPIFGRMSRDEWMRWAWLHMDHHLRQFGV